MFSHTASSKLPIGSFSAWLSIRLGETLFSLAILASSRLIVRGGPLAWIFVAVALYGVMQAHQVVYGYADGNGVCFRRYWTWKRVDWNAIDSLTRQSLFSISIEIENASMLNRHIVFLQNVDVLRPRAQASDFIDLRKTWMRSRTGD